jgi:hypothetical protein
LSGSPPATRSGSTVARSGSFALAPVFGGRRAALGRPSHHRRQRFAYGRAVRRRHDARRGAHRQANHGDAVIEAQPIEKSVRGLDGGAFVAAAQHRFVDDDHHDAARFRRERGRAAARHARHRGAFGACATADMDHREDPARLAVDGRREITRLQIVDGAAITIDGHDIDDGPRHRALARGKRDRGRQAGEHGANNGQSADRVTHGGHSVVTRAAPA